MKIALLQMTSSDDPAENREMVMPMIAQAAQASAQIVATPEVTNCVSDSRRHQRDVLQHEAQDETLVAICEAAKAHKIWVSIGSLALKSTEDERFINRSFLINPAGEIIAWYDKLHMFDVTLSESESYRESDGYKPGDRAVVVPTSFGTVGLSICYDVRFPYLYRDLAKAGAEILMVPAAFACPTGQAHWEVLLRARAIETGCFVIAPAQTGTHSSMSSKAPRQTYGHSMIIAPWGEVLLDAGTQTGVYSADIDIGAVKIARDRVPSLRHDRDYRMII